MIRIVLSFLVILVGLLSARVSTGQSDEVLVIYVANETRLEILKSPNYLFFLDILEDMDNPDAALNRSFLVADAEKFSTATRAETRTLLEAPLPPGVTLAIVTNTGLLKGHVLLRDAIGRWQVPVTARPDPTDPITFASPVLDLIVLNAALEGILSHTPAPETRIVMIFKSHGDANMAMMPRLSAESSKATRAAVRDYFSRFHRPSTVRPAWNRVRGVTKSDFYAFLNDWASRHQRNIDLVIVESCTGGFHKQEERLLPLAINRVFTSGTAYLDYRNFRYDWVLSAGSATGVLKNLIAEVNRIGLVPAHLGTP